MKRLFFVAGIAVIAFVIYALVTGDGEQPWTSPVGSTRPTVAPLPTATPTATAAPSAPAPSTPAAQIPQPTVIVRTPPTVVPPAPPRPVQSTPDARSQQVRQIIFGCAQRAKWTIRSCQQTGYNVTRVTGYAINDNVGVQRFISGVQDSGILVDFESGPSQAFTGRDGRSYLESTFTIKWR